ncbi:hypothetical protein [Burkholderia ubonensis]|uniref:hypothetical protein n=1 Tax=Burkholderia ubonensis TaxID=101571 RepID=UPI002AB0F2D5|nr:hypothetical protein [Burkholderia ubonensis]
MSADPRTPELIPTPEGFMFGLAHKLDRIAAAAAVCRRRQADFAREERRPKCRVLVSTRPQPSCGGTGSRLGSKPAPPSSWPATSGVAGFL